MDLATGFGMLAMGLIAIMIASLIIYKVVNMIAKKEKEDKKFKPKKFEDFFKEQNLDSWLKNGA